MYIRLNKMSGKSLYISLYEAISEEILSGRLPNGSKLTPRRLLAEELKISQNTVDAAYKMLQDTGYVISVPRQGYIVSFKASAYNYDLPWETDAPEQVVFSPNGIDTTHMNTAAYAKIVRDIAYNDGMNIFSYVDKSGEFALRNAISKFLYSFRNIKCSPDRIIIGAGAEYLLVSLAAIFDDAAFITENPCDSHFYDTLKAYRNKIITLPANSAEFNIEDLYNCKGNLLFVEPDARFPRSSSISSDTRQAIIEWATMSDDRYIIELGNDSELQWQAKDSIYSMDTCNKVIYLSSFSRSIGPGLKTAYMLLPPDLLTLWKKKHTYYYSLTSKTEQFALAEFINKGHFTKHYKNMRRIYREKREYLKECMHEFLGDSFRIINEDASTYITFEVSDISASEVKRLARRFGVKLLSLNSYHTDKNFFDGDLLIIGTGDLSKDKIKLGIRLLSEALS